MTPFWIYYLVSSRRDHLVLSCHPLSILVSFHTALWSLVVEPHWWSSHPWSCLVLSCWFRQVTAKFFSSLAVRLFESNSPAISVFLWFKERGILKLPEPSFLETLCSSSSCIAPAGFGELCHTCCFFGLYWPISSAPGFPRTRWRFCSITPLSSTSLGQLGTLYLAVHSS